MTTTIRKKLKEIKKEYEKAKKKLKAFEKSENEKRLDEL